MIYLDASWSKIKELNLAGEQILFNETEKLYKIYVFQNNYQHELNIFKTLWPVVCHKTVEQNASEIAEFEASYKAGAVQI